MTAQVQCIHKVIARVQDNIVVEYCKNCHEIVNLDKIRKEAVEGFGKYMEEAVVPFLDGRKIGFRSYVKDYLESEGK